MGALHTIAVYVKTDFDSQNRTFNPVAILGIVDVSVAIIF